MTSLFVQFVICQIGVYASFIGSVLLLAMVARKEVIS